MARLWIDALTPKQALFAQSMVRNAPREFECAVTTRDYFELNKFVSRIGLKSTTIGRHGGGELLEKLKASVERQRDLISYVANRGFDCSFSFISPEAARVSFGLAIKHFISSDSPHSVAPSKLTIPLSQIVFSPFPIIKTRWTQYGITESQVVSYRALDPWVWLSAAGIRADPGVTGKILIRFEESFASYFKEGMGVSSVLSRLVDGILAIGNFKIILLPRYEEQRSWARKIFGDKCIVPDKTVDGAEEISKADLLIGGGATMTQEAALLGIPNISYFPSANLDVFTNYYFPKKMSIEARNSEELLERTFPLLKRIDAEKKAFIERAQKETKDFEDPLPLIFEKISENLRPKS